jgi:phage baseplate assembly protein gpV
MSKINGVVVAKVKDRNSLGQVLVKYDWLPGNAEGYWAPIATTMSGSSRGSWFMPEKEDEVLVCFEHGDVQHPYVVGFLWNGKQKPPSLDASFDADPQRRMLKSVNGHMIELYDPDVSSSGEAGYIRVRDRYGNEIVLGNGAITINGVGMISIDAPVVVINGRVVAPTASPI